MSGQVSRLTAAVLTGSGTRVELRIAHDSDSPRGSHTCTKHGRWFLVRLRPTPLTIICPFNVVSRSFAEGGPINLHTLHVAPALAPCPGPALSSETTVLALPLPVWVATIRHPPSPQATATCAFPGVGGDDVCVFSRRSNISGSLHQKPAGQRHRSY